jgi:hypothetical protein
MAFLFNYNIAVAVLLYTLSAVSFGELFIEVRALLTFAMQRAGETGLRNST